MESRTFHKRIGLVLAALIALGLILSPVGRPASHDAALVAELALGAADHGHFHDEFDDAGADDDQRSSHSHSHNPSDHSHQTLSVPASFAFVLPVVGQGWLPLFGSLIDPKVMFRLDRPPRV